MPVNFQRLRAGQPWRVTQTTADAILASAEEWSKRRRDGPLAAPPEYVFEGNVVEVRNDSGYAMPRFGVAGINGPLIDDAANLLEFQNYPRFRVGVPAEPAHIDRFCILVEPLANGQIGRALVSGVAPVQIYLSAGQAAPYSAGIANGQSGFLRPGTGGARVLSCAAASSSGPVWALVRIAEPQILYGLAQSDWQEGGTRPGDPFVFVQLCDDRRGTNARGANIQVFLPRCGDQDPQVYGYHASSGYYAAYPGDVVQFRIDDFGAAVAVGSYLGPKVGTVQIYSAGSGQTAAQIMAAIPHGWCLCDGSNGSPDLRGLFVRGLEQPQANWIGGDAEGIYDDGMGGHEIGVSCTRDQPAAATGAGTHFVNALEDAPCYARGGNGGNVVVCPPCYTLAYIYRYK